jgi:hypothetical protein
MATGTGFRMTSPSGGRVLGHRITWYVWASNADGDRAKLRHTASMRGRWTGWDATCKCGWQSRTGGAIKASVQRDVWDHKLDVHLDAQLDG